MQTKLQKLADWLHENVSLQKSKDAYRFLKTWQPSYNTLRCDSFVNSGLSDTKWAGFRNHGMCRLKNVDLTNKEHLIYRFISYKKEGEWEIHADDAKGPLLAKIILDTS